MSAEEDNFDDLLDEAASELQEKLHLEQKPEEKKPEEAKPQALPGQSAFEELGIGENDFQDALKDILNGEEDGKEAFAGISEMMSFLGNQLKDMDQQP